MSEMERTRKWGEKKEGGQMNKWGGMIVGCDASQASHIYRYNNHDWPTKQNHCVLRRLDLCDLPCFADHPLDVWLICADARQDWDVCKKGLEGVGPDNLIWICIHLPLWACTNGNQLSFIRQIHFFFIKFKLKQPASLWRQFSHSGVFLNVWLTAKL